MRKLLVMLYFSLCLLLSACVGEQTNESTPEPKETESTVAETAEETTVDTEGIVSFENYIYQYPSGRDREWETDVVTFANIFLTKHPAIADTYYFEVCAYEDTLPSYLVNKNERYDVDLRNTFTDEVYALIDQIPELSDLEIQYELCRIAALLGDAHTNVIVSDSEFFPLMVTQLEDGSSLDYYCTRIPSEFDSVMYSRLVTINGIPLEEVIDMLRPYVSSENSEWEEFYITDNFWNSFLIQKDLLQIVGVVPAGSDTAEFGFAGEDDAVTCVTLSAVSSDEYDASQMTRVDFYAKRLEQWEYPDQYYWYELRPEDETLYVRISKCYEISGYSFSTFCDEILEILSFSEEPLKLVIDLRGNTGGKYPMSGFEDFTNRLKSTETSGTYILIDHGVFSSGNAMAGRLSMALTDALLVGTPTGQPGYTWGKPRYYNLLYSPLQYRLSTELWIVSDSGEEAIMPDITVYQTLEDYRSGVDTVLAYVLGQ